MLTDAPCDCSCSEALELYAPPLLPLLEGVQLDVAELSQLKRLIGQALLSAPNVLTYPPLPGLTKMYLFAWIQTPVLLRSGPRCAQTHRVQQKESRCLYRNGFNLTSVEVFCWKLHVIAPNEVSAE
jgi:hypothetical protein